MNNENKEVLLHVEDLKVTFGTKRNLFTAVGGVSFDIYKGETFGLVGESGSGKTTIGRAIIRIHPTADGKILYKGQQINGKISKELDKEVTRKLQKERDLTYLFISHDLSVMRFICDRIAVIHKGLLVELAECEKLFAHPLHPYTRALLSAIPQPNPITERNKQLEIYDPSCHDYSVDKPEWVEIEEGHFVLGNKKEIAEYREKLD